jgi:pimeloyl-ACP methyl ester carboxylesterase
MKSLLNCFLLFWVSVSLAQPFSIGRTTLTFTDPDRNNRLIATEIYYPANSNGSNVPVTTQTSELFPIISFGHGFLMTWDAYQNIWEAFVPQGFVVVFPKTEGGFSPSHLEFGRDLAFVIQALQNLSNDSNSIFFNRIHNTSAVMGHSMGGGAAHLAVAWNPTITTILTLAPAETNPSAISAAGIISIPSLVIAGENDCVTPPSQHQLPIFNALNSSCKSYVSITGGSHCQMANTNLFCNIGENSCSPSPEISSNVQHTILNTLMLGWLNAYLKEDCISQNQWLNILNTQQGFIFSNTCEACSLHIPNSDKGSLEWYPNPVKDELFLEQREIVFQECSIYDFLGKKVKSFQHPVHFPISLHSLDRGVYWLQWVDTFGNINYHKLLKN